MTEEPMAAHALRYAQMGVPVFMLNHPDPTSPCGCSCRKVEPADGHSQKHPLRYDARGNDLQLRHGHNDATTDQDVVELWWKWVPEANIGAATGVVFDVVDFDSLSAYNTVRDSLSGDDLIAFDRAPAATTGRPEGGRHLFFSPSGLRTANGFLPKVDFKGGKASEGHAPREGSGFVVLSPSVHKSGRSYGWLPGRELVSPQSLDPLPQRVRADLEAHLDRKEQKRNAHVRVLPSSASRVSLDSPAGQSAREGIISYARNSVLQAPDHEGWNALRGAALFLSTFIHSGALGEDEVRGLVTDFSAQRSSQTGRQRSSSKIDSLLNFAIPAGMATPRELSPRPAARSALTINWTRTGTKLRLGHLEDGRIVSVQHRGAGTPGECWEWKLHGSTVDAKGNRDIVCKGNGRNADDCGEAALAVLSAIDRQGLRLEPRSVRPLELGLG